MAEDKQNDDLTAGKNKKKKKKLIFGLIVTFALIYILFAGKGGLLSIWKYYNVNQNSRQELKRLNSISDSLKTVASKLEQDTSYMIKYSRENYGFVRDGEKIIRFQENERSDKHEE